MREARWFLHDPHRRLLLDHVHVRRHRSNLARRLQTADLPYTSFAAVRLENTINKLF